MTAKEGKIPAKGWEGISLMVTNFFFKLNYYYKATKCSHSIWKCKPGNAEAKIRLNCGSNHRTDIVQHLGG